MPASEQPRLAFRIDEEGLLRLLRGDLYDRDDVYLRELIQNAADSEAMQVNLLLLKRTPNTAFFALACVDNGRGMTRSEIEDSFLNLCRPVTTPGVARYGRFGIGVFTYLAFA